MLIVHDTSVVPAYNLAKEEYFFRSWEQDIFMLWRNDRSIIVGKHQNTLAEINAEYVKEHNIPVIRRMSGGGAVFHDLGNLNFTFITSGDPEKLVDFRRYTQPIIEVLQKLGVQAEFSGRNDLTIDGKKFSGNAEHTFKNRILHHGTLLFSAQMADLSAALQANPLKFTDKAVKSVQARVTNISEHLPTPMTLEQFTEAIYAHINERYPDCTPYHVNDTDKAAIQELVNKKYGTWEWNFGYSPKYNFAKGIRTEGGTVEIHLDVHDGIIQQAKIFGDFFHKSDINGLEEMLVGVAHNEEALRARLQDVNIHEFIKKATIDELIQGMF